jgi:beta-N-acetylhexosaminidase
MRTIRSFLLGAAALVLVAGLAGAGARADESGVDIRGTITSVTPAEAEGDLLGSILVEGERSKDTSYDKASIRITRTTKVLGQDGKALAFEQLTPGLAVEAEFEGPVAESYPVQATASGVLVLDPVSRLGD